VPNLARCPEIFRNDSNVIIDGKRYFRAVHTGVGADGIIRPAVISERPGIVKDILKPEYKGKVAWADDPSQPDAGGHSPTDAKCRPC
jgi:hypothetical protein